MRPQIAGLAGTQARLTIAAPVAVVNAGTGVTLTGQPTQVAGGAPLAGARVELQQVGVVRGVTTTIAPPRDGRPVQGGGRSPRQTFHPRLPRRHLATACRHDQLIGRD